MAFSRFLEVSSTNGLLIASAVVFVYAVLGGMKGITYTQVAQYCVLIIAYTIPAHLHLAAADRQPRSRVWACSRTWLRVRPGAGTPLLVTLDGLLTDLGFKRLHDRPSSPLPDGALHGSR